MQGSSGAAAGLSISPREPHPRASVLRHPTRGATAGPLRIRHGLEPTGPLSTPTGPRPPLLDGHLDRLFWTVILTASFGRSSRPPLLDGHLDRLFWTVISTASFGRSSRPPLLDGHLDRLFSAVVAPHGCSTASDSPLRRVESWSLTQLRVHRVQRRAFQITRHPHLPAGAPWHPTQRRVTAGPSRSMYGLVTFVTISVPPAMLPTSSPTSRFIVASSSSGTQHHRLGVLGHSGSSSVPTSPLPPAWSQLIDDARHLASSAPARAARRASAPPARLAAAPVTSPLCLPLRRPVTAPQPELVPTFHADVAVADRVVVVRH